MWHQWLNHNFIKLQEQFLCAKKTKTFDNNFFSSVSEFDTHSRLYHDVCVCIPLLTNKAQHIWVTSKHRLLGRQQYTHALCYSNECASTDTEEKKSYYYRIISLFSPLMSHGLLYWCPYCLSESWMCELHCCLYGGPESSRISSEISESVIWNRMRVNN